MIKFICVLCGKFKVVLTELTHHKQYENNDVYQICKSCESGIRSVEKHRSCRICNMEPCDICARETPMIELVNAHVEIVRGVFGNDNLKAIISKNYCQSCFYEKKAELEAEKAENTKIIMDYDYRVLVRSERG